MKLIISCEHASDVIPHHYQYLFKEAEDDLLTHKAIDFGAEQLALALGKIFNSPCILAKTSRLLIDLNRSLNNKNCFSDYTSVLDIAEKKSIIDTYYTPYRNAIEELVHASVSKKQQVFHLSVHSFTPVLHGVTRDVDFGLLYDPSRAHEKAMAYAWKKHLVGDDGLYRIRMNYPYRGSSDGFTSALRMQYDDDDYLGLELEVNQRLVMDNSELGVHATTLIIQSLKAVFNELISR